MNNLKFNYHNVFLISFRFLTLFYGIYFLITKDIGNLLYCLLIFLISILVEFLFNKTNITSSLFLRFLVQFFIFLSMFIGHVNEMYTYIASWDDILHLLSGFIIAVFALLIITTFFKTNSIEGNHKFFVGFFILIFGVACSGFWEIFEFTTDTLFSLSSQNGSLNDTMMDMINGSIGPFLFFLVSILKPNFLIRKRL